MSITIENKTSALIYTEGYYANTIEGQIKRIADAHEIIQEKAINMGLKVQANEGDTKPANAAALTDSHTIMDTASAINSINVRNYLELKGTDPITGDQSINSGDTITIPTGYNKIPFTITANSISDQLGEETNFAAKYLFKGKTAYTNVNNKQDFITGTLDKVKLKDIKDGYLQVYIPDDENDILTTDIPYRITQQTASKTGSATENGIVGIQTNIGISSYEVYSGESSTAKTATQYLRLSPKTGYYNGVWDTNILYNPAHASTVEITKYKGKEGEETITVNTVRIPAGYYPNGASITPILKTVKNEDGSITEDKYLNYSELFTIQPVNYFLENGNNRTSNSADIFTTFKPEDEKLDYFKNIQLPLAKYDKITGGQLEVKTAGWIDADTYGLAYGGLNPLTHNLYLSNDSGYDWPSGTNPSKTITTQQFTDVITRGYNLQDQSRYYKIQDAVVSIEPESTGNQIYVPVINTGKSTVVTGNVVEGVKPQDEFYVTVTTGEITGSITYSVNSSVVTPGWIDRIEKLESIKNTVIINSDIAYIPIMSGSHEVDNTIYQAKSDIVKNDTIIVKEGSYYVKCDTNEGYQKALTDYIVLPTGSIITTITDELQGGIEYNSTKERLEGTINIFPGYFPSKQTFEFYKEVTSGTGGTLTTALSSKTINANTYYNEKKTINVKSVVGKLYDVESGKTDTNLVNATNTTLNTPLWGLSSDTTFYGKDQAFFSSFKVEVEGIIAALKSI